MFFMSSNLFRLREEARKSWDYSVDLPDSHTRLRELLPHFHLSRQFAGVPGKTMRDPVEGPGRAHGLLLLVAGRVHLRAQFEISALPTAGAPTNINLIRVRAVF